MLLQQSRSLKASCFRLGMEQRGVSENSNSLLSGLPFRDQSNLLDTYYPQRPNDLEDVCLYDFVANYDYCGTDNRTGKRQYRKLTKPRLPNHRLFERCLHYLGCALQPLPKPCGPSAYGSFC